uniref:RING-type E3 ubiquitin transferase n=1 Tax=Callorhinchus milii TaxID=7868 RepID=A0A4W3GIP8_CALMI
MVDKAREFSLDATQTAAKRQCEKHREELKMFCETDKKLICSICRDVKKHRGHSFLPIDEAAEIYKVMIDSGQIRFCSTRNLRLTEADGKRHSHLPAGKEMTLYCSSVLQCIVEL